MTQRNQLRVLGYLLAAVMVVATMSALPAQKSEEPLPTDVEEKVEVRLAILDVLVLDGKGRTVPDLGPEEFEVTVNGRDVEIASVDVNCPVGVLPDPRGGEPAPAPAETQPFSALRPLRVALAFDFRHFGRSSHTRSITLVGEAMDQARAMLLTEAYPNEEIMVVAMGDGLRIETPFTMDRTETLRALERLQYDPMNFGGQFDHMTENAFFSEIKALLDVLETVPGHKAVVLFTGPLDNTFTYDPHFRELAALSATARVSIYPVDSGGMRVVPIYSPAQVGGPEKLARVAVETGGRLTWNTNDLGLGYTRARRDAGCTYEIAFYDDRPRLDRERRVRVWLSRQGLRTYHSSSYVFRSRENKRRSLITAAYMAPMMFDAGNLNARAYPFAPKSDRKWKTLVAIGFAATPEEFEDGVARWEIGGVIRKDNGTRVRSFNRRIEVGRTVLEGDRPTVTFVEPVSLRPGRYQVSVVLSNPETDRPRALTADLELPEIPINEPFLVGPILGRSAGEGVVIYGRGLEDPAGPVGDTVRSRGSFEPLIAQRTERGVALGALTQVCLVGSGQTEPRPVIHRSLLVPGSGSVVGTLPPVTIEFERSDGARCQTLLDWLPTESLEPGSYSLEARPGPSSELGVEAVGAGFRIVPGSVAGEPSP